MKYEKPNMDILEFDENDIATTITTSPTGSGTPVDPGDWW